MIFGNDEWVVPATDDERRFAVFNVGEARRQDRTFFGEIKDGMRDFGGDQLLFKFLNDFDLSSVDINLAPDTDALMSQKEHSLGPLEMWWFASLKAGRIVGSPQDEWGEDITRDLLRSAFYDECKIQNLRGKLPNDVHFGRAFQAMAPSSCKVIFKNTEGLRFRVQVIAPLEQARKEWETFIRGKVNWDE